MMETPATLWLAILSISYVALLIALLVLSIQADRDLQKLYSEILNDCQ